MTEEEGVRTIWDKLIQLIIIATIFGLLLAFLNSIYTDDTFEKRYTAKDLALALEAIQIPQGNTALVYQKDTDRYTLMFEQGRVQVFKITDQPEPPIFLRGISYFSTDKNIIFRNTTLTPTNYLNYLEKTQPLLIKTGNNLEAADQSTEYNLKLYYIKETSTVKEQKDLKFSTNSPDQQFQSFVQIMLNEINAAAGAQLSYSETEADIMITKTSQTNIIYAPQTEEKRKLANIIANKFIEQGTDIVILPSKNEVFTIQISEEAIPKLSGNLKEAFEEYYETE